MIARLILLCTFFPPLAVSRAEESPTELESGDVKRAIGLHLARNDREVVISWMQPEPPLRLRGLEIYRNTLDQGPGRKRVKSVDPDIGVYCDLTPEADATYWYWLKITLEDGRVVNIGPVPTPAPDVWQP